jgi:TPR repeat protein
MCLFGDGIAVNHDRGWRLLNKAAHDGNIDAEYGLAVATLKKIPGAPDLDEAIRQAEAAETGGHPEARIIREKLEALRTTQPADTSTSAPRPM